MKIKSETATILFLAVGIIGISLSVYQISLTLHKPFENLAESPLENSTTRTELTALQEKDTDRDGLSDFDELYLYNTSPFISDSDSDGIKDNVEISIGQDPNCPEGKTCKTAPANTNSSGELANYFNINSNSSSETSVNNSNTNPSAEDVSLEQLREALIGAGVPAETINSLDDETLRQMYNESLAEESTNTNSQANSNTNASLNLNSEITVSDLESLSVDQIRSLLAASGVSADAINQLDDATVKAIFDESLKELTNQ